MYIRSATGEVAPSRLQRLTMGSAALSMTNNE